ncbi:MAG: ABC transporter permease, partial [Anaerolineae bacterium]|nr:ABC transporter permease [Anaerolineae bacterium]
MMWSLLRKVWRDLVGRRARTALTILGIAIGVAGLVAIVSTARNLTRAQRALYASSSQADITFWVWNAPASLASLLERDPRIVAAELRTTYITRWQGDGSWRDIELIGIADFGQVRVNQFDIVAGRAPRTGELLLDLSASQEAGVTPGEEISLRDPNGRERTLRVSGISRSPGYLSSAITNIALGYVPAQTVRRMLDIPGSNQLLIKLRAFADGQSVSQRVTRLLRRQGLQAGAPVIRDPANFAGKRELDALIVIMFLFSGLGLVLSSTLVINTLSASVAEQVDEIGVIKALGGTRGQILLVYLMEAAALGLCGTL